VETMKPPQIGGVEVVQCPCGGWPTADMVFTAPAHAYRECTGCHRCGPAVQHPPSIREALPAWNREIAKGFEP
jgi:hypothetical protein